MTSSRNKDKQSQSTLDQSVPPVDARRRRLIKGAAAAAPGIFTLYSGNAQAMLSNYQCTARNQHDFTGEVEYAGEEHIVDSFVRLAEGDGIHVVWKHPTKDKTQEKWLIEIIDQAGLSHYIEAGYFEKDISTNPYREGSRRYNRWMNRFSESGKTWNEVLTEDEWVLAEDSGSGIPGSPLKFQSPSFDPNRPKIFEQDFSQEKKIQVLACIDDSGNIVSAYPQDCDAEGLTPPSGSCWASIGTESVNKWWG